MQGRTPEHAGAGEDHGKRARLRPADGRCRPDGVHRPRPAGSDPPLGGRHARGAVLRAAQLPRPRTDLPRRGIARRHHHRDGLCRAHADRTDPAARRRAVGVPGNDRLEGLRLPPRRDRLRRRRRRQPGLPGARLPRGVPRRGADRRRGGLPRQRHRRAARVHRAPPGDARHGRDLHPVLGGLPRLGRQRSRPLLPLIANDRTHSMQPSATPQHGNWMKNSAGYQTLLVFLLSLNFGIVFFDRQATNVLMPLGIESELGLSQTQIGVIAGGMSFTWAIAAFFVGGLSDSLGKRKVLLILATIAFSLCSFLSGLATSFLFLFAARLLMGAAEGGVMPISHAMVASEVDPKRRGLAQGVAQNLGSNLLGSFAAPVVLVAVAQAFSWREAFYFAALPGLLSAALIWFMLREPEMPARETRPARSFGQIAGDWFGAAAEAMKVRNMWTCVVVGILMVAHFVITWAFMPLFLVNARGMDETSMSYLMGSLGIA